jgi:hypothetical protein|tara:strand:- start:2840 stop:3103 length:264 start_codon:yes stop_codon:yes gene_type:complete
MENEMTYKKFMQLLHKVRQEADTVEEAFENTDKLLYNILDRDDVINLVLECLTIIAQSDIPIEILENPYGVLDVKKEDKKPDLKIVH